MPVLKAMIEDDTERRTFQAYTADCLGVIAQSLGSSGLPLYSEILEQKSSHEQSPEEVIDHVKKLFS